MNQRANALADRLEQGARALVTFASTLTDAQWQTRFSRITPSATVTITSREFKRR